MSLAVSNQNHFPSPLQCPLAQTHPRYQTGTFRFLEVSSGVVYIFYISMLCTQKTLDEYVLQKTQKELLATSHFLYQKIS